MKTERIYSHNIDYWFNEDDNRELDECDIEHIGNCLAENNNQGELLYTDEKTGVEYRGWWIIRR